MLFQTRRRHSAEIDNPSMNSKSGSFSSSRGTAAGIPPKAKRRTQWESDRELYRERNLIEREFNKLKHWRRIATPYDRRSIYFLSALHLVSSVIWG